MGFFDEKTVLVTGATGLIGSHLIDQLMHMKNVRVIALSRSEEKLKVAFSEYLNHPNFKIIAQNISEKIDERIGKIDFIFHAASPMEGKIIANTPVDVIVPNLTGTVNCLEFLKNQKQAYGYLGKLILFSSVTVYGNNANEDLCVTEKDTRVTDSLESVSAPYSQSKRMSEVIALAYSRQYGIDSVIARLSTVYGDVKFIPDTAFYEFIRKAVLRENITVNSSCVPRRDNIHVDDAVSGLLCVAEKGMVGEAYNISSNGEGGNYAAVDEIAQIIAEISNLNKSEHISVQYKDKKMNERKPGLKLDNAKLKALGWNVRINMYEGIERTLYSLMSKINI